MKASSIAVAVIATAIFAGGGSGTALAQTVKVTPLGSHDGEFCRLDRAMIFEDPDGTRVLYDAGRTVAGPDDPRLGDVDAVLLSHVHGDHLGDRHIPATNAGDCGSPDFAVSATPNSNSVNIVAAKGAKFIVGSEMASFFSKKVESAGGSGDQVQLSRYGASRKVGGVTIATVPAVHSNGLNPAFIEDQAHAAMLKDEGLTSYIGPPNGYVLRFSNGLVAYLSGDTGITAEQDLVVRRHYGAQLAVMNIGDVFTTGPTEAAYVINELVKPASVIPSHANEVATEGGEVVAGSRTDTFMKAVKVSVHLPLSGRTMEFDKNGKCKSGC